jgi:elongation factor P
MLTHSDLKKGVEIIVDGEPYEILEANPLKMAQRRVVIQSKIKNLITGNVLSRNFHQGDTFEEAKVSKSEVKFLYLHRNQYFFAELKNPSKRFSLNSEQIGPEVQFLKPGQIVEGIIFQGKVINISLPIKIQLRVTEAPPGVRGDKSQSGTKQITLETGAKINAPLFIKGGDIIEVNTDSDGYVRRIE